MGRFRFLTAGESHGKGLVTIIEGMPAGVPIDEDGIARDMKRRQAGYGRGGRMKIEQDRAEIVSGVRHGLSIGSPIALLIANRDWDNWKQAMAISQVDEVIEPRETRQRLISALELMTNKDEVRHYRKHGIMPV